MITKTFGILLIAISVSGLNVAALQAAEEKLPDAQTVLDKYIEVIGGKDALTKISSKITESTMSIPAKKTEIKTTTFQVRPRKVYSTSALTILGKTFTTEAGTNGDVVWEVMPRKQRIISGVEKECRLMDYDFDGTFVSWKQYYKNIKVAGVENVNGKPCYKVLFTPLSGETKDSVCYFDKASYLITKIQRETIINGKNVSVELELGDYKKVDNILVPHTVKRSSEGADDIIITINSIKSNVDIPSEKFALPEKIKELVEKG